MEIVEGLGLKIVINRHHNEYIEYMGTRGQGHSLTKASYISTIIQHHL